VQRHILGVSRGHLLIGKLERMALDACARIELGSFRNSGPRRLGVLLLLLSRPQPHPRASPVLIDELDLDGRSMLRAPQSKLGSLSNRALLVNDFFGLALYAGNRILPERSMGWVQIRGAWVDVLIGDGPGDGIL
jgi:hypothetical protein